MRKQQFLLDLINFIVVDHSVEFIIIAEVHVLEKVENTIDVFVIRMFWSSSFLYLFHYQHVFRQSLDRFNQVVLQREQLVRWIQPRLIYEVSKDFALHEFIDGCRTDGIIIQILEVEFEEVHLFLHFFEDDLEVPVILGLLENGNEEQFIQSFDLIDVHEDDLRFFPVDDLFVEQRSLEIGYHDTHISDIVFLCFE
jgi:hypothetical protein